MEKRKNKIPTPVWKQGDPEIFDNIANNLHNINQVVALFRSVINIIKSFKEDDRLIADDACDLLVSELPDKQKSGEKLLRSVLKRNGFTDG